jgi:hypothetical protein
MAIAPKSGIRIGRRQIAMMEAAWTKMWDPPQPSPKHPHKQTRTPKG